MRRYGIALLLAAFWLAPATTRADDEAIPDRSTENAPKPDEKNADANKDDKAKKSPYPAASKIKLFDPFGKEHTLEMYRGKWIVLEWLNHGCPFVKKHYAAGNMQALQKKWTDKGVIWLAICSSAPGRQGHYTSEQWKKVIGEHKSKASAILLDPTGAVGRAYDAKKTPTVGIVDPLGGLAYWGAIDDAPRAFKPVEIRKAKNYIDSILTPALAGKPLPFATKPAYG